MQTNKVNEILKKDIEKTGNDKLPIGFKDSEAKDASPITDKDLLDDDDEETNDDERNTENVNDIIERSCEYNTRDESWLDFNKRILEIANNKSVPLFERFSFLGIASKNLDEFITVRIPKLNREGNNINNIPFRIEQKNLLDKIDKFSIKEEETLNILLKELKDETKYKLVDSKKELTEEEKDFVKKYFDKNIKPLITPIVADNKKPFPVIKNKSLNIGVILKDRDKNSLFATIQIPEFLPRIIKIVPEIKKTTADEAIEIQRKNQEKGVTNGNKLILIEDLIRLNLTKIFIGKEIKTSGSYRILRDLNYKLSEETFIVDEMKHKLKSRDKVGSVIKLESDIEKDSLIKIFKNAFFIKKSNITRTRMIDLSFCNDITKFFNKEIRDKLSFPKFIPKEYDEDKDLFEVIDDKDIILHHPYDSYDTVLNFINQAAEDKHVICIKQTLYRVSNNSPIIKALVKAAENGKEVTVVLEATARFDEANNLKCADKLEHAGAHVVYGITGKKVHAKMCLVTKRKKDKLYSYAHIGTGNYNENNAKIYTDFSLFTSRKNIINDLNKLFNAITGFSEPTLKRVLASPYNLRSEILSKINNEINVVKTNPNGTGRIIIKVNGLTDKEIVDKLYEAADAGVKIDLIVRGSCSAIERKNLTIHSILGRFLEHSRIFYFKNQLNGKLFIGSSDLMSRNLDNRIELMVPVDGPNIKKILNLLDYYIKDNSEYTSIKTVNTVLPKDNKTSVQNKLIKIYNQSEEKLENESYIK